MVFYILAVLSNGKEFLYLTIEMGKNKHYDLAAVMTCLESFYLFVIVMKFNEVNFHGLEFINLQIYNK